MNLSGDMLQGGALLSLEKSTIANLGSSPSVSVNASLRAVASELRTRKCDFGVLGTVSVQHVTTFCGLLDALSTCVFIL